MWLWPTWTLLKINRRLTKLQSDRQSRSLASSISHLIFSKMYSSLARARTYTRSTIITVKCSRGAVRHKQKPLHCSALLCSSLVHTDYIWNSQLYYYCYIIGCSCFFYNRLLTASTEVIYFNIIKLFLTEIKIQRNTSAHAHTHNALPLKISN